MLPADAVLLLEFLEVIPDCAALVQADGTVFAANAVLRTAHSGPNAKRPPAHLRELVPEAVVAELLGANGVRPTRAALANAAGVPRVYEWTARRLSIPGSEALVLVLGRDGAREASLENYIVEQQSYETAAALSGGLAHDFNNVLAAILGLSEIISLRLPSDSPLQDFTRKLGDSVDRAKQLVRRFAQFSRNSAGTIDAQPTAMVLSELAKLLSGFLPGNVTFKAEIAPATPWCLADRHTLDQILINCTNFLRTRLRQENGQILLQTSGASDGHFVEIQLRGSGQGLLGFNLNDCFALSLARSNSAYESGAGMFAAKVLAERQNATLVVERNDPRTITFILRVPTAPP